MAKAPESTNEDQATSPLTNDNVQTMTVKKGSQPIASVTSKQSLVQEDASSSLTAIDGVTLSPDHPTLNLSFSVSNYQIGDVYTINIPRGDLWYENSVHATKGDAFTSQVSRQSDGSYIITDTFTKSGAGASSGQTIILRMRPNVGQFSDFGNVPKNIIVRKNGQVDTNLEVFESINPKISCGNVERTTPAPGYHNSVRVNQQIGYTIKIKNSYLNTSYCDVLTNYHFGKFDLVLNVPKNFKANTDAMKSFFAQQNIACGNITQKAIGDPIIFSQCSTVDEDVYLIHIIGQYVMPSPTSDTPVSAASSEGTFVFNDGHKQQFTVPAWTDTIEGNEKPAPVGDIFQGAVYNEVLTDQGTLKANTIPLSGIPGKDQINNLQIVNVSSQNASNVHFIASFSRGYSATSLEMLINYALIDAHFPSIKVTYQDGSVENVTANSSVDSGRYLLNPNKQLKSIEWDGDLAASQRYILRLHGKPAAGMTTHDKLTASIGETINNQYNLSATNSQQLVADPTGTYAFLASNNQRNYYRPKADPNGMATDNDGLMVFQTATSSDTYELNNLHIYLLIPKTVDSQSLLNHYNFNNSHNSFSLKWPGKVKLYHRNGRDILELDGEGNSYKAPDAIQLYYQLKTGVPSMSDSGTWFISADNLRIENGNGRTPSADEMALLDGALSGHTRAYDPSPEIEIVNQNNTESGEFAQGNQDPEPVSKGTSDDKEDTNMTFVRYVLANKNNTLTNIVTVTNLPQANDGQNFGFKLSPNGVEVLDSVTGEPMNNATILYSTQLGNSNNQKTDLASYKPASEVSDWGQIKSVVVKLPSLTNDSFQILFHGIDPTLANDAQKTGVLTGQTWADEIPIPTYNGTDTKSKGTTASVKVEGKSTIHILYRYMDKNGISHLIEPGPYLHNGYGIGLDVSALASLTFSDNQENLSADKIWQNVQRAFTEMQYTSSEVNAEYGIAFDQYSLLDSLNKTKLPQATLNSDHGIYPTDEPNLQLSVDEIKNGALAKYYMDGDSVIFDIVPTDSQKATVKIVDDDENGRLLATDNALGATGDSISFAGLQDQINSFLSRHYQLDQVTNDANGQKLNASQTSNWGNVFGQFDDKKDFPSITQRFTIHLKHHKTSTVTTTKTFKEIIHYKYNNADRTHSDRTAKADYKANRIFKQLTTHDEVTNRDTPSWDQSSQTFDAVATPPIDGYTADPSSIDAVTVTPSQDPSKTIEKTVYYTPDQQKATVKYIDDTTRKQLRADDLSGYSDEHSNYTTKDSIDHYKDQGYVFVSDNTNGQKIVFDHDDKNDQIYEVHLKHDLEPAADKSVTFTEIVHYKYNDAHGNHTNEKASNDSAPVTVTFTQTGNQTDQVTGEMIHGHWDANEKTFSQVDSPSIAGFTPDQNSISGVSVKPNDAEKSIEKMVYYTPDQQTATVKYIDDTTGQTLATKTLSGHSDEHSGYTTTKTISDYHGQGYDLVSDSTDGHEIVYDHDDSKNQTFAVHLKHGTAPATDQATIKRTIRYVYANGQTAQPDKVQKATFSRTGTTDKVTNKTAWNAWLPAGQQTIPAVTSPTITGYTPSDSRVDKLTVTPTSQKETETTVTYLPDTQIAHVIYVDDDQPGSPAEKTLKTDSVQGKSNEAIDYSTANEITKLTNEGYVLVSDDTATAKDNHAYVYDTDDDKIQAFYVHLEHGTTPAKDQATITRTIHYVYADGQTAKPDKVQKVTFSRTGTTDKVTNKTAWNAWSSAGQQTIPAVTSPTITGYTPSDSRVDKLTVTPTSQKETEKTVTYTPDPQTATVTYIDDTTGQTLATKTLSGHSDEHSGYTTTETISGYQGQGYDLVSDSTDGHEIVFDHDDNTGQSFEVHFVHGTQPVTDTKTVTRTIHYIYPGGTPAHPDTVQTVTFKRTVTQDKVTKHTEWDPWNPADQTMTSVVVPTIPGYQTNIQTIPTLAITPNSSDTTVTVVYTRIPVSMPGQSGQPGVGTGSTTSTTSSITTSNTGTTVSGNANAGQVNNQVNGKTNAGPANSQQLPQTGNSSAETGIIGLMLASIAGLLGFGSKRKHD